MKEGKTPAYYMRQALTLAAEALELGEFPIAAIVVLDGKIIARATASEQQERRYLGHAELVALEKADRQGLSIEKRRAAKMFTTLEPKVTASLESLTRASDAVAALSGNLEKTFVKDDVHHDQTVKKLDTALETFTLTLNNVNDIVGDADARQRLKESINSLPEVLANLEKSFGGISTTIETADRNLRNLEGLSKPLGERGESMVKGIDKAISRLDDVLLQAATFTQALNESQGTLGKLVRDPQVYNDLAQAANNVNRLTQTLRPIIDDVRVFTDKIARHPEQLGVRGALDRRPGLK